MSGKLAGPLVKVCVPVGKIFLAPLAISGINFFVINFRNRCYYWKENLWRRAIATSGMGVVRTLQLFRMNEDIGDGIVLVDGVSETVKHEIEK